ncbi:DUF4185 domain-containing protein [Staphylococcus chromogenes]|nr:DUF4185 domain-containing protein [Staphylococcus chromogenes]
MRIGRIATPVIVATIAATSSLPSAYALLSSLSSDSVLSSSGDPIIAAPANDTPQGLDVTMIGDLLGPTISGKWGIQSGDLGEMAPLRDGQEFAIVFGDSFRGPKLGDGEWMSPVGVVAKLNAAGRIEIVRPLNPGERVEQLIKYQHNDRGLTLLPSDIINVDGTLYLQAMWNEGVGNVLSTEIWKSTDNGKTWQSIAKLPANYMGGMGNLITWEKGPDGYIYIMSSQFKRSDDIYLSRFRPDQFDQPALWEHYAHGTWGSEYAPIVSHRMDAGEMSLRYIEGHWVLSVFNAQTAAIEVRIADSITADWNAIKPARVVVSNGGRGMVQDENNFTQLYGGYIVPGSTLANMDFVVSQWNTTTHARYNSTQFNVKGLDKFFHIGEAERARIATYAVEDSAESTLQVTTTEAPAQPAAPELAPVAVVPMG